VRTDSPIAWQSNRSLDVEQDGFQELNDVENLLFEDSNDVVAYFIASLLRIGLQQQSEFLLTTTNRLLCLFTQKQRELIRQQKIKLWSSSVFFYHWSDKFFFRNFLALVQHKKQKIQK